MSQADQLQKLRDRVAAAVDAYLAAKPREQWRHLKTGGVYEVLAPTASLESEPTSSHVVYRGEDGRTWIRPYSEFHDGRFERVPHA